MRTLLLLILMIFSISEMIKSQSNTYHPFPESNVVWIESSWYKVSNNPPCVVYDYYNLFISGDTTIGLYTYNKIYQNDREYSNCPSGGLFYYYGRYWGAFRQDSLNRKVYMYKFGQDTLAYDFNLSVGDTLAVTCLNYDPDFTVTSIDSVLIGAEYRKRFWLNSSYPAALVEGVGNTFGAFASFFEPFESGSFLTCLFLDSMVAWTDSSGGACALTSVGEISTATTTRLDIPNPFTSNSKISATRSLLNSELKIFNILGELIYEKEGISGNIIEIEFGKLSTGILLFRLVEDGKIISSKKVLVLN